jgi:hypothetical protein
MRLVRGPGVVVVSVALWKPTWGCHARISSPAAHHESCPAAAALRLPRSSRRPQQFESEQCIDRITRVAPCNRGWQREHAHWCGCRGTQTPCTLVERGVQSAGRRARSVGCWVRLAAVDLHGAARPRQACCRWRSSFFLWVACMLSVYLPCNSHALKQGKVRRERYLLPFVHEHRTDPPRAPARCSQPFFTYTVPVSHPSIQYPSCLTIHHHTTMSHVSPREQT